MSTGKRRLKRRDKSGETKIPRIESLDDFIVDDEEVGENVYLPGVSNIQSKLISSLSKKLKIHSKVIKPIIENVFYEIDLEDENFPEISLEKRSEYLEICQEMENEIPDENKIMKSNLTRKDKKFCLKLWNQLQTIEEYSNEYFQIIERINNLIEKSKFYTKKEIEFLEKEEEKLKKNYVDDTDLKNKILNLQAESYIKSKLLKMYDQMMTYPVDSSTHTSLKEEIEWSIRLPYQKREVDSYVKMNNSQLNEFYSNLLKQFDKELYGMEKVKERIIHILNDRRSSGDECGRNICLVGNPGVGKTQICKVLAKLLDKKFAKISAGALDSAAIKGSNRVWSGSEPSIILQNLATLKTNNAIIQFDEIDKLGDTPQGKLAQHALLHVSDPSDNREFQDNYLKNFSHDLSKVLFIYCMNNIDCIDDALKDRLDIIYIDDYNNNDKFFIFKNYMLPKTLTNLGLNKKDIIVTDSAIKKFLDEKEIGLRTLEKIIKDLVSKINMYKNSILSNGTLGDLKLSYSIPNFKIPLKIDYEMLKRLT